jgi:hypothetical protein
VNTLIKKTSSEDGDSVFKVLEYTYCCPKCTKKRQLDEDDGETCMHMVEMSMSIYWS